MPQPFPMTIAQLAVALKGIPRTAPILIETPHGILQLDAVSIRRGLVQDQVRLTEGNEGGNASVAVLIARERPG